MGTLRLFLLIRRHIKDLLRILNIQRRVTLLIVSVIGDKGVAERKFLQETNFQEDEFDEDIIPERRGRDQVWRSAANAQRPESLRKEQREAYIKSFIKE